MAPIQKNPLSSSVVATGSKLKVVTWNIEHLAFPLSDGCKPRSAAELEKLSAYAASLDADIVAFQEVSSKKAAQMLFPAQEWNIHMSERADSEPYICRESGRTSTQQKIGFAVRNNVKTIAVKTLPEFGLKLPGLRYGLQITVDTSLGAMTLLNLHLKSGCFVDDYTKSELEACQVLSLQAPVLDSWIESREKQNQPYLILGDFNHRLSAPYNRLTRSMFNNSDQSTSSLRNRTRDLIGCHSYYPAPIDHIFSGHLSATAFSFKAHAHDYQDMQPEKMLSDHCAVSLIIAR